MIRQDLRSFQGYVLGIVGLVLALFIPFAAVILRIFKPLVAALLLGVFVPFAALVLGIIGFVKSSKQSTPLARVGKILSILAIITGFILVVFNLYIFIKGGVIGAIG